MMRGNVRVGSITTVLMSGSEGTSGVITLPIRVISSILTLGSDYELVVYILPATENAVSFNLASDFRRHIEVTPPGATGAPSQSPATEPPSRSQATEPPSRVPASSRPTPSPTTTTPTTFEVDTDDFHFLRIMSVANDLTPSSTMCYAVVEYFTDFGGPVKLRAILSLDGQRVGGAAMNLAMNHGTTSLPVRILPRDLVLSSNYVLEVFILPVADRALRNIIASDTIEGIRVHAEMEDPPSVSPTRLPTTSTPTVPPIVSMSPTTPPQEPAGYTYSASTETPTSAPTLSINTVVMDEVSELLVGAETLDMTVRYSVSSNEQLALRVVLRLGTEVIGQLTHILRQQDGTVDLRLPLEQAAISVASYYELEVFIMASTEAIWSSPERFATSLVTGIRSRLPWVPRSTIPRYTATLPKPRDIVNITRDTNFTEPDKSLENGDDESLIGVQSGFAVVCGILVWAFVVLSILHFRHEKKRKQGLIDTKKKVAGKKFGVRQNTGDGVWDYEVEFDAKGDGMARAMARSKMLINMESSYSAADTDEPRMYRAVSDASTVVENAEKGDGADDAALTESETYGFDKMGLLPSFGMGPQDLLDWSAQQQVKPDGAAKDAGTKNVRFGQNKTSGKSRKSNASAAARSAATMGPRMTSQPAKVSRAKLSTRLSERNPSFGQSSDLAPHEVLSQSPPMPAPPPRQKPEERLQQEALAKEFSEWQQQLESRLSMLQHTIPAPSNGAPVSQADLDAQLELAEKMLPPGGYGWLSSMHKLESTRPTSPADDRRFASRTEVVPRRGLPGAWGDELTAGTATADGANVGGFDDMSGVAQAWGLFLEEKEEKLQESFSPPNKALSPGDTKFLQMPSQIRATKADDEDMHSEVTYDNSFLRLKPTGHSEESEETVVDNATRSQRLRLKPTGHSEESEDTVVDEAIRAQMLQLKPTGQSDASDDTEFDEATWG